MGGIGKTELALQYAQRYWDSGVYPAGACWLTCRGADVGTQLVGFATGSMGMTIDPTQTLSLQVAACWRNWPDGYVLIVFDDVTDYKAIQPYLPPTDARFKVLVTTRLQLGTGVKSLALDVLASEAALILLRDLAGPKRLEAEPEVADWLCEWLGYLPLGLELVGRYLERKPDLLLTELRQRLEIQSIESQALLKANNAGDMTASLGVTAAFDLSWQDIGQQSRLPQELLYVLSVFGLAPIRWQWVEQAMADVEAERLAQTRDEELLRLHLVKRVGDGRYQLHQIVREYAQNKFNEPVDPVSKRRLWRWLDRWIRAHQIESCRKSLVCEILAMEAQQLPWANTQAQIQSFREVVPHLQNVIANSLEWAADNDLLAIFTGLGKFYKGQGDYGLAEPWAKQCVEVVRDRLGECHPDVAASLNNLASLYEAQGRYEEAEPLYKQALAMGRKLLGGRNIAVFKSLGNLAGLYLSKGRYEEAETFCHQALEMSRELLGDRNPNVATGLHNLAESYRLQGRYEEATTYCQQSLDLKHELFGDCNPAVADSLNNLGLLYWSQRRYKEAELYYQQALEMRCKVLDNRHPDVAESLSNLASLYHSQSYYEKAGPLYQQALEIDRETLGDDHPNVAITSLNLAELYTDVDRFAEAEPLYLQALSIFIERLGHNHTHVKTTIDKLFEFVKATMVAGQEEVLSDHPLIQEMAANITPPGPKF